MKFLTISVDDGLINSVSIFADLLEKYKMSATFNVVTSWIDFPDNVNEDPLNQRPHGSWDDYRKLSERGFEIGSHSLSHKYFLECEEKVWMKEIKVSRDRIKQELGGKQGRSFAFPYFSNTKKQLEYASQLYDVVRIYDNSKLINRGGLNLYNSYYCFCPDPDLVEKSIIAMFELFCVQRDGWLIINLHGIDGEGYAPISATFFDNFLGDIYKRRDAIKVDSFINIFNKIIKRQYLLRRKRIDY